MRFVLRYGAPKPGHEFEYWLAWKHRGIASEWMTRAGRKSFKRLYAIWARALDRQKEHGQDIVQEF